CIQFCTILITDNHLFVNRELFELLPVGGKFMIKDDQMQQGGANPADNIKGQKSFWPPVIFQYAAKHPKDQHVPEDMRKSSVEEHICDYLVWFEKIRSYVMKREIILNV